MKTYKYNIAVSGSANVSKYTKEVKDKIADLGTAIAKSNCTLVSGATTGVPHIASVANHKAGGFNIGFSPAASRLAHIKAYKLPVVPYNLIIFTGRDYVGRDETMTKSSDAVIVAAGRIGTMHEFLVAFETGKVIGVLTETGGVADFIEEFILNSGKTPKYPIIYDSNPERLVEKVIKAVKEKYDY